MELGDIRYTVYFDPSDSRPWVCPCEVIKISPKKRVVVFKAMDTQEPTTFKEGTGGQVAETKFAALKQAQRWQLTQVSLSHAPVTVAEQDKRILWIIKLQKLMDEISFCPSI